MNVRLVHTTVIKSVPTLKAPLPVPVTVDIHSPVMEDHALVCHCVLYLDIAVVLISDGNTNVSIKCKSQ